jgi:hypothetical protein
MIVDGQPLRPVRALPGRDAVEVDRPAPAAAPVGDAAAGLPRDVFVAIRDMWVRGAPLIGATAAYGLALQMNAAADDAALEQAAAWLQPRPAHGGEPGLGAAAHAGRAARRCRRGSVPTPPGPRPTPWPNRTCRSTPPSAATAWPLLQAVARARPGR